ncbi:uromodulin-like 1 [Gopherus evgoodei]|uniref:uromodulin-like 1 n=1 Tax=Gopherus evgoodei TaxID=1825980 RepID=UPI0011CF24FB|nr:uromodulin-like 1 [Gopherus evgoodei]
MHSSYHLGNGLDDLAGLSQSLDSIRSSSRWPLGWDFETSAIQQSRSQLSSPICKGEIQRKIFPYSKNLDVITSEFLFPENKEIRKMMPIFAGTMTRIIVISFFILWTATGQGKGNVFTEKGLSLLGYHLCNYSMTKTVSKMVAYQKSYEKHTSCGGWIPRMVCLKTSYKTQYRIAEVPEIMNFTDCCEGYEQVGFYCTLSLNRSNEFASSPGVCPEEEMDSLNSSCTLDTDCPGLKKCCNSSKGTVCVDPVPEERNLKKYWYNVSVLVKMDFNELSGVDPRLLNHSRLLHSMMTGALWPLNSSVYHIQTTQAETYAGTLASQVLIGLHQPAPLMKVSSLLKGIVKRVYEVINIDVQDVNECSHAELNACSRSELCINLEGYYNCTCEHEPVDRDSGQPQKEFKDLSSIGNHRIVSVTSSSFEVSWNVNSTLNHTFQVQVYKGKELLRSMETTEMKMDVSGLEAGIKYTVKISYEACGKNIISYQNVKTDAQIFGVTIKILNYNFTEHFHNTSSSEYQEFSRLLLTEIENIFPPNISILYKTGKLKVQIESLKAGSIIVRLRIIVQDPEFPVDVSTFAPMLSSLYRSSVFLVDQQSTSVEDWDECASRSENDCCMYAECINLMGSYMCRCKTTMDTNPSRPGRNCEGEIVNPVSEMMPLYESGKTEIPPETSTGLHASPAITEIRTTTLSSKRRTILNMPTVLPSSGTQASSSHSSISSPPLTQRQGMTSSIGFERNNSTIGMEGPTTIETLVVVTEQWKDVSASLENSVEETLTGAPEQLTTVTSAPKDATSQEQHTSPLSILSMVSNTTSAVERNKTIGETHIPPQVPEASSQDGSSTSLPTTEHPTIYTLSSTLDVHEEMGRVSNSWSETSPRESFSVPPVSPDFSPPAFSATTFPNTDCIPVPAQRIIFSSVTGISFHVAWSTDSALNPAFRFLLLQENQLISEAKIQSTSLTVPGLEPGILYTVEITTEVCGMESKPTRQKVKTAVQKLNGSVRITNVKYTAGLNNASSEEYHNFTQLFLGEVRKSLPLNRLQEMDLGLIKMLITSITNGSIVVGFDLLTAKDLDIHSLSTAFHDVFKNSSYFTVDNSFSIRDYDECEREEDDCSPDASCHNTYGSYQCSCNEGFADLNSERPGRNCEAFPLSLGPTTAHGKHVGSTGLPVTCPHTSAHVFSLATEDSSAAKTKHEEGAMFSSTAMPHASTASVSNAHSSPHVTTLPLTKSSQGMSLKDAVRVFCEIEKIVIAIQKIFLQQESISESALYLGEPHCNVSFSNDTHVVLWTSWNRCGTKVQSNMTKTIVKTILRNDNSSQKVIHNLKIVCPIHCVFQNNLLTSSGYSSEGVYTFFEDLHGSGYFITEMQLFVGNSSVPQNFSVSASDDILIEVGIQKEDSNLKVVVTECWATPTSNSGDPLSFGFINNSCPVPEAYTTMIENGNSRKAQFKLKIFSFVNNSVVYLHCKIRICVETSESTCRTSCQDVRSLKSGEIIATHRTSWGPLCRATASDTKSEKAPGLGIGSIILIVIAVFVFVLGVVALSVSQYQRKTGRYNFKIKSDNFSYQVFYD